jgi:hypothetical protein
MDIDRHFYLLPYTSSLNKRIYVRESAGSIYMYFIGTTEHNVVVSNINCILYNYSLTVTHCIKYVV